MARAIKFIRNSQSTIKIFLFSLILMLFSGTSDTHSGNDASDAQPDPKAKIIKQINDGLAQSLQPTGAQIQVVDIKEGQGKIDFTATINLEQSPNLQMLFTARDVKIWTF